MSFLRDFKSIDWLKIIRGGENKRCGKFAVCFARGFCAHGSHVFEMLLINLTDRNIIFKTNLKGGHSIHFTVKSHNLSLQPSSKIEMLSKASLRADILACDILVTLAVP